MGKFSIRLFLIFITCLITINSYSEEKTRIAVLNLEGKNVPKTMAGAVTEMITTELVRTRSFSIVERNQIHSILNEQGFQQTGCTDQDCAVKIGRLLSAQKILLGSVSKVGTQLVINVRIVDVEKGVAEMAAMEKAENDSKLPYATKRIARKIAGLPVPTDDSDEIYTTQGYYLRGIVPGWGQIYIGSPVKGSIFLGTFITAGALTVYSIVDFYAKRDAYLDLPLGASQSEFDKKNDAKNKAGIFAVSMIGVTAFIYAANWVDLLFFNSSPGIKTLAAAPRAGDIFFNAGTGLSAFRAGEREYNVSLGMRF